MTAVFHDTSEWAAMYGLRGVACCTGISDRRSRIASPVSVVCNEPFGVGSIRSSVRMSIISWTSRLQRWFDPFDSRSVRIAGLFTASFCILPIPPKSPPISPHQLASTMKLLLCLVLTAVVATYGSGHHHHHRHRHHHDGADGAFENIGEDVDDITGDFGGGHHH